MIKEEVSILERIKSETEDDPVMQRFLLNVIEHEKDHGNYATKYKALIENAIKEGGPYHAN